MSLRPALVVPVALVTAAAAAGVVLLATRPDAPSVTPCPVTALAPPPAPVVLPSAPSAPVSARPVGDQYFADWGRRMAAPDDGPPRWFLLSESELASARYGWEMPQLTRAMAAELGAVLDEGCRGAPCTPEAERARAAVHAFADDDQGARTFTAPRVRRWTTAEDVREDHRQIALTGRQGALAFDVACTCTSWTVGMRMWNDIAECEGTLRDHGRTVLRYAPTTQRGYGKESTASPLAAYTQTVTLGSGDTLTIESGYEYAGDDIRTPRTRGAARRDVAWTTAAPLR